MGMYFVMAVRNILQARRRSTMLFTALSLVSMLLVLLLTLSQGINDTIMRSVTLLVSGHVNVAGYYKAGMGPAAPLLTDVADVRSLIEANTPGLDYIVDRQRHWAKLISDRGSLQVGLTGVDLQQEPRLPASLTLAPESSYKINGRDEAVGDVGKLGTPGAAVLFAWQAKRLGVGVGDVLTASVQTLHGTSNTAELHVVAVVRDFGYISRWVVFVPKSVVQHVFQASHETSGSLMVYLKKPSDAENVMMHLHTTMKNAGYSVRDYSSEPAWHKYAAIADEDFRGEKLDFSTWSDEMGRMAWSLRAIDSVSTALIMLLLLLIVLGLINGMWMAVRERTQEIGTLRALGMSRQRVLIMFLVETTLLGAVAASAGSLLAAAVATGVDALHIRLHADALQAILMSDTLRLSVRVTHVLSAIALLTGTTLMAALWPALRAARMQPVTAIAHV